MRFDGVLEAYGVRLRSVTEADAEFMFKLRTLPTAIGRVGDPPASVEAQRQWIANCLKREGDYCFIVEEVDGGPVGTVSLTVLEPGTAEPGRWIVMPQSLATVASSFLIYSCAFEYLRMRRIAMCVVSDNLRVLSHHRRYGAREVRREVGARKIQGELKDLVWFEVDQTEWPRVREYFRQQAELAQSLMNRIRA